MLIADTNEEILNFFNKHSETYGIEFIYLHGEIQRWCNYDCFHVTTEKEYEKFMKGHNDIFDVKVCVSKSIIDSEIKTVDATAYVWQGSHNRRGLVVLKRDAEGNAYAKEQYDKRVNML